MSGLVGPLKPARSPQMQRKGSFNEGPKTWPLKGGAPVAEKIIVTVSFLRVSTLSEALNDTLVPNVEASGLGLRLRENRDKDFYVEGLTQLVVADAQELLGAAMDGLERAEMLDNNDEAHQRGTSPAQGKRVVKVPVPVQPTSASDGTFAWCVACCERSIHAVGPAARTYPYPARSARPLPRGPGDRSHKLLTVTVHRKNLNGDVAKSTLNFLDTAGVERPASTTANASKPFNGKTAAERRAAMKSGKKEKREDTTVKAIIRCTDQLHDGSSHVSYRDSKVTRLLAQAMGGNAHGVLVACVSAASADYNETLAMLTYLNKCCSVHNSPKPNMLNRQVRY